MEADNQDYLLRFDQFEIDLRTRELRRQGEVIRLQDLPVRLLIFLATRPGKLVTREEIEQELWGDEHFVDYDHGINTAMRKVREALGENTESPRFVETLPRKGYRFIAEVHRGNANSSSVAMKRDLSHAAELPSSQVPENTSRADSVPASHKSAVNEEFTLPTGSSWKLLLLTQAGYLVMYCVTLFKLEEATGVLERFFSIPAESALPMLIALALSGVAVRLFLLTSVGLKHPHAGIKYRKLFPMVMLLDIAWSASPLLLVDKLGMGLSMAAVAGLAYLPFSQRILMNSLYPLD